MIKYFDILINYLEKCKFIKFCYFLFFNRDKIFNIKKCISKI